LDNEAIVIVGNYNVDAWVRSSGVL